MTRAPLHLGPGGRLTTKLGFGCSNLSGGLGRRSSLALLEAAYDAGIRHFDVAPMYGFGTAEKVLGEFARRHAGSITIATKYGIAPPSSGALWNTARTLVRPLANRVPGLRRRLVHKAGQMTESARTTRLSSDEALRSLEQSLRNLHVDRLDLFLLHEAEVPDLEDSQLLQMLEKAKSDGKILQFGVASDRRVINQIAQTYPEYCPVTQHEWTVLDEPLPSNGSFPVCHRTIAGALTVLQGWLEDKGRLSAWSAAVGMNLANPEILAGLLLNASCARASGVVLFSTRKKDRIEANVRMCLDAEISAAALRLLDVIDSSLNPGTAKRIADTSTYCFPVCSVSSNDDFERTTSSL